MEAVPNSIPSVGGGETEGKEKVSRDREEEITAFSKPNAIKSISISLKNNRKRNSGKK